MIDPIIIGFAGYKQSGKDSACVYLKCCFPTKQFPIVTRIGFADPIKRELAKKLGVETDWIEENKTREDVRKALQTLGSMGRQKNLSYWIDKLTYIIDNDIRQVARRVVIIPDVRFPNEEAYIHGRKGLIFRIERKGQVNEDRHESEIHIPTLKVDFIIHNDQTLIKLRNEVRWIFVDVIMPHFQL